MRIRLVSWAGHGNLGDDEMQRQLIAFLDPKGHVFVEKDPDWTILGGGTMLQPRGEFMDKVEDPTRTIGWGIGAADTWTKEGLDKLQAMPAIFCRDDLTYEQLKQYGCNAILSFDPLCATPGPPPTARSGVAANVLKPNVGAQLPYLASSERVARDLKERKAAFFALGNEEDVAYVPDAKVFHDFSQLVAWLGSFKEAACSRLHANVAAYVARVPYAVPLVYDAKVSSFLMRVAGVKPEEARQKVLDHMEDMNDVLIS